MSHADLFEALTRAAAKRLAEGGLGLLGGITGPGGMSLLIDERPVNVRGTDSVTQAWRLLVSRVEAGGSAGIAVDLRLTEGETDSNDGDAFEVHVESVDGAALAAVVPYRRGRFRVRIGERLWCEPEHRWMAPGDA